MRTPLVHLYFDFFTYNSSVLVGSAFGATWEDPEGGIIKFAVKRALKQDQTLHMEGKLQFILYFSRECVMKPTSSCSYCNKVRDFLIMWSEQAKKTHENYLDQIPFLAISKMAKN